jgi:DNA-binding NarL/FixJ family response regulator
MRQHLAPFAPLAADRPLPRPAASAAPPASDPALVTALRPAPPRRPSARPGAPLTRRERDVLDYLVLGYTNAEIGLACGTSPNTIKHQLQSIFRKLDAATRAEAVRIALVSGLVSMAGLAPARDVA